MISSYLLASRVRVRRPSQTMVDGIATTTFEPVPGLENVPMRLEVNFNRPGKDVMAPQQAGRAPDRTAVYWCAPDVPLQPGDQLECVSGPVEGVWEIRVAPDPAQNMTRRHHFEGQAIEMSATILSGEVL